MPWLDLLLTSFHRLPLAVQGGVAGLLVLLLLVTFSRRDGTRCPHCGRAWGPHPGRE